MKKLCVMMSVVGLMMAASAEMKLVTVNMVDLVRLHPSYETNRKLLKDTAADYRRKLEARQESLKAIADEGKKVQSDLTNPMLSPAAKAEAQKKLEAVQTRFMNAQRDLRDLDQHNQTEIADLESRLLRLQTEDIRRTLAKFAKAKDYDLILDASLVGFAKESLDVTDAVLKEMGIDPAKRREKKEEK